MKKRSIKLTYYVFEILAGIVFLIVIVMNSIHFNYVESKSTLRESGKVLKNISFNVSKFLQSEMETIRLLYETGNKSYIEKLKNIEQAYEIDRAGNILQMIKKNPFASGTTGNIRDSQLFNSIAKAEFDTPLVVGPYYSLLAGKRVISIVIVGKKRIMVMDINLEYLKTISFENGFAIIYTSIDGIALWNTGIPISQKYFPVKEGWMDLPEGIFYHDVILNPLLNCYIHILDLHEHSRRLRRINYFYMLVLVAGLFLLIFVRYVLMKYVFLKPLSLLGNYMHDLDREEKQFIKEFQFREIDILQKKFKEMVNKIQFEIRIEEQLKNYYDIIINSSPNIFITTDMNDNIVMINKRGIEYFGAIEDKNQDNVPFERIVSFTAKENSIVLKVMNTEQESGIIREKEIIGINETKYFDIMIYGITEHNRVNGMVYILIDVDDRRSIEKRMVQSKKLETVGIMAGGFAHDFNNLLTIILGNVDVYNFSEDSAKKDEMVQIIRSAAVDASDLIKQILIFSQQKDILIQPLKAEPLLKKIIKLARRTIPRNISITDTISTFDTEIMADANMMVQVFLNILLNAGEAIIEKKGEITLSTLLFKPNAEETRKLGLIENHLYLCTIIADNGVGIKSAIQEKIFDPFYSTKARGTDKGTGMGLSIVYGVIKTLSGGIDFKSLPGVGTTFYVYLPVSEASQEKTKQIDLLKNNLVLNKKNTMMIIDNDMKIRNIGEKFANLMGCMAISVESAQKGKMLLHDCNNQEVKKNVSVILLDISNPNSDAKYIIEYMENNNLNIPIIIMVGYFQKTEAEIYEKYSFVHGVLEKPFTFDKFHAIVSQVLKNL